LARTFEKADASRSVSDDKKNSLTAEKAYGGNGPASAATRPPGPAPFTSAPIRLMELWRTLRVLP